MKLRGRHYVTGEWLTVTCAAGRITAIAPSDGPADREAGWIAPAMFDLQINGARGIAFNASDLTTEQVREVVDVCRGHGIAGLLPTLITGPSDAITHGLRTLTAARAADPIVAASVPGYHIEGPYISPEDGPRGAHPREHVRPPDWDEFCRWQDAAEGRVRLLTLSPEHDNALSMIERVAASGVVVAIGHTAASPQRIREAVAAGARLSTHLGNGSHAMLPRHDNYLWEQLAADGLWASIIPDGHHLPPVVLKCVVRVKTPARTIVTCDASSLAGLPPGRYSTWGAEYEVRPEGRVVVPGTPFLAGAAVFTDACLGPLMRATALSLSQAIDMAGARPRELLGLPAVALEVGSPADLMLFDWEPGADVLVREIVTSE